MMQEEMSFIPEGHIIYMGMDLAKDSDETIYMLYNADTEKFIRITKEEYDHYSRTNS